MRVLLADDDPDQLSLRCMLLERSGFEAMGAGDYVSAVELAAIQKPECAVVDLRLPTEELGLRLVCELKRLNPAIHVIVLTGGNPGRLAGQPEAKHIEQIIAKGASTEPLIRKLRSLAAQSCV